MLDWRKDQSPQNDMCPFSWVVTHKQAGCLAGLFGVSHYEVAEPRPCMKSKCKLWDRANDNCVFMTMGKSFSSLPQTKKGSDGSIIWGQ